MADDTKPETPAPKIVPQTGEATAAAAASPRAPAAGATASAPATGANPAATPHATTTPAARPAAAPRPPAAPIPDLAGKTTNAASPGGAAAAKAATTAPAAAKATTRDADDTSPLLNRRAWMGLAWGAFSAASAAALAATGRFMFPNVLNEPPQQFKAGFPNEYGMGVDERWKEKYGIWIVRTPEDIEQHASGFYSLSVTCTHLGLHAELSVGGKQVQVPVPRQRLPHRPASTSRGRRRVRSSARASCWPRTGRSWSTRAATSSASWDSGPIRRRF